MTHETGMTAHPPSPIPHSQSPLPTRGFALPAALFLLVVLAGLSAWLVRSTQISLAQGNLELVGARAYQAAQAGLEAGIYTVLTTGTCIAGPISGLAGDLADFTASVSCTPYTADEGGQTITLFTLTSIACNQPVGGGCPNPSPSLPEYAERHVTATVER
jgi:MSHA biogenesis protein MshP